MIDQETTLADDWTNSQNDVDENINSANISPTSGSHILYICITCLWFDATVKNCKNPQIAWIYALKTTWKGIARSIDHSLSKKA